MAILERQVWLVQYQSVPGSILPVIIQLLALDGSLALFRRFGAFLAFIRLALLDLTSCVLDNSLGWEWIFTFPPRWHFFY